MRQYIDTPYNKIDIKGGLGAVWFMSVVGLLGILFSCTPIDQDDYLIEVETAPIARAVLIEDFTGQRCANCPEATDVIEQLIEDYGEEHVIAVGIHSMPLGFAGNAKNIGLMNDAGKDYGEYWQVQTQPCGFVNRSGGLKDRNEWKTLVHNEIQKPAPVAIALKAVAKEGSAIEIDVEMEAPEAIGAKLQLWIVEDGITAMQTMPTGEVNREYVHNHVFRATVNGQWGDDVNIASGKTANAHYDFTLADDWKAENCSVVAFIYTEKDGVMQAAKTKIRNND